MSMNSRCLQCVWGDRGNRRESVSGENNPDKDHREVRSEEQCPGGSSRIREHHDRDTSAKMENSDSDPGGYLRTEHFGCHGVATPKVPRCSVATGLAASR